MSTYTYTKLIGKSIPLPLVLIHITALLDCHSIVAFWESPKRWVDRFQHFWWMMWQQKVGIHFFLEVQKSHMRNIKKITIVIHSIGGNCRPKIALVPLCTMAFFNHGWLQNNFPTGCLPHSAHWTDLCRWSVRAMHWRMLLQTSAGQEVPDKSYVLDKLDIYMHVKSE